MSWLRRLISRQKMEIDLDKDLRFHFESQVANKVVSGIAESESRRLTRLEFRAHDLNFPRRSYLRIHATKPPRGGRSTAIWSARVMLPSMRSHASALSFMSRS
jgi:hypothetical protein